MSRLERWSHKKRGIEHESDDSQPAEPIEPQLEVETHAPESDGIDASSPAVDEQEATAPPLPGSLDHTLPDPDTLPAGSDFSAFMVPGVSAALRRRALRRLWATGNYNVRDGLDDYDADFTQQLTPMASELAGKLRRWANKAEETLEKLEDSAQKDAEHSEKVAAESPPEQVSACTSDDSFVQSASPDDQSDYPDHAPGERRKDS